MHVHARTIPIHLLPAPRCLLAAALHPAAAKFRPWRVVPAFLFHWACMFVCIIHCKSWIRLPHSPSPLFLVCHPLARLPSHGIHAALL
ncbi:hypothetical protein EON67_00510 [archaeon]|nr:MAG: hypothetical protein EON67_00510 [archaeon]